MPKTFQISGYHPGIGPSTANTSVYYYHGAGAGSWFIADETGCYLKYKRAGTISNLSVKVSANTVAATSTFTLRKNATDTSLVASITSSGTGQFEDTTDTVSFAANDQSTIRFTPGAATGGITITTISTAFAADVGTNTVSRVTLYESNEFTAASTTGYKPIYGAAGVPNDTTEANTKCRIRKAGTFSNAGVAVYYNFRTTATTLRLRKNGANANQVISISASTSGWIEDTTNTDTAAAGDDFNWQQITGTGVENIGIIVTAIDFVSTAGVGLFGGAGRPSAVFTDNTVRWILPGLFENTSTAEVQAKVMNPYTFSDLTTLVTQNGVTSASTLTLRKNAVDTTISVSITASATGVFTDADTVAFVASDLMSIRMTAPSVAGTQTVTLRNFSLYTTNTEGAAITRSLTAETITVGGGTIAEIKGSIRTRTETAITVGETRARLAAKNRAITTQTVTLSENIIRIKGKVKTLATETITVGGGTIAKLLAKIRTATDTTAIVENRARLAAKNRALATQTVTIGENLARIKGILRTLATQTVTVTGGTLARLSAKMRALAAQTVIITEDLQRTVGAGAQNIVKTISQTVTLSESINRLKGSQRLISDTIIITAGTIARLSAKIRAIPQTISLTDNSARLSAKLRPLALQTIALTESLARIKGAVKTISQTVVITGGTLTRLMAKIRSVSQTIAIAENVAIETVGQIVRSIVQTITVSDNIVRRTVQQRLISQTTAISESVARAKGISRTLTNSIIITESLARIKSIIRIISQIIIIGEQANRLSAKLRSLVTQTITLSDGATSQINVIIKHVLKTLSEIVTLSESLTTEVIRASQRFRRIVDPSNLKLKSNHPAYLLGTKGQHDDYIEF